MARSAALVDKRPLKQLRFARECSLDVRSVQGVELRPEDLAGVATADLLRREPEELDVRTVGDAVAQTSVPVADHRRQGVQDRANVVAQLPRLTAAGLTTHRGS